MTLHHPVRRQRPSRPMKAAAAAAALAALSFAVPAQAGPSLSFNSSAQVYGSIYTQYSSPLLGDVSFTLNGPSQYLSNYPGSGSRTTGVASVGYTISAGLGGVDPVYDIVTSSGQYGFGYSGQAETAGLTLHSQIAASTVDISGQLTSSPNSTVNAWAQANWNQQFYIPAATSRKAGSYGAILVSYTLDGNFPALSDPNAYNNASAYGQASTSFTDTSGVSYQSSFGVSSYAGDSTWTGSTKVYKKLLFQYGTVFSINLYQYASAYGNGSADFFNTGYISSLELPAGATLDSGAQQAGLGTLSELYGSVTYAATVDDINTNWDFGNNGGGFNPPPVPEPSTWTMLLSGLVGFGWLLRRRGLSQV